MPIRVAIALVAVVLLLAAIVLVPVVGVLIAGLGMVALIALGGGFGSGQGLRRRPRGLA